MGQNILTSERVERLSPVDKYASEIPAELSKGINGLNHMIRRAILVLLVHNDSLSFTELAGLLNLSKGKLAHHLDVLQRTGLVRNFSKADFAGPYDSYYSLSKFGESLFESLAKAVQPSAPNPLQRILLSPRQDTPANPKFQTEKDLLATSVYSNLMAQYFTQPNTYNYDSKLGLFLKEWESKYTSYLSILSQTQGWLDIVQESLKVPKVSTPTQAPFSIIPDQTTAATR